MSTTPGEDTWRRGNAYEDYVGRWSRRVAPRFLDWLDAPRGRRWLDVGCGTGALSAAIIDACAPASVASIEPSGGFLEVAQQHLRDRATLIRGDAMTLPLRPDAVDLVASALVLNFLPDPLAALRDMVRVTIAGGTVAAYVWDYAERMELIRAFWDVAVELDPEAMSLDEARRFPLCRPEPLVDLFSEAGLTAVAVEPIDIPTEFATFDDYWAPFLGGQGPAPTYALALDGARSNRLRDLLRDRLPVAPDGSISLVARAWAIRGNKP